MTREQRREKLIVHYRVLAQLALGAATQLDDKRSCTTLLDMMRICQAAGQRITNRQNLIGGEWRQEELDV